MSAVSADMIRRWYDSGFDVQDYEIGIIRRVCPTEPCSCDAATKRYEGSVIDLTLGRLCRPDAVEACKFGITSDFQKVRYIPEAFDVPFRSNDKLEWHVSEGQTLLFETYEHVNVPMNYYGHLFQAASLLKGFVMVFVGEAQANFQGKLQGLIHVAMPGGLDIMKYTHIISIRYHGIDGPKGWCDPYKGNAGASHGDPISTNGQIMVGDQGRVYKNREEY